MPLLLPSHDLLEGFPQVVPKGINANGALPRSFLVPGLRVQWE